MSLFESPEDHAANPPETWRIVKYGRGFAFVTKDTTDEMVQRGGISTLDHFERKRDAVAALSGETRSWALTQYERDTRWYAGETPPGQRSWAECKVDRERAAQRKAEREAAERRKIERQGITPDNVAEWRDAFIIALHIERESDNPDPDDDDAAEIRRERLDGALDAMRAMLDHITGGNLMNPDLLTDDEAAVWYSEMGERFGLTSWAGYYIDRIKYKGLDTELSALEMLEQMERDEREAIMPGLLAVNA